MNLTGAQEKFVKMSAQALAEWREGLGPIAWVILGILLLIGMLVAVSAFRLLIQGRLRPDGAPKAVPPAARPASAKISPPTAGRKAK
jgi:hypothetical protein